MVVKFKIPFILSVLGLILMPNFAPGLRAEKGFRFGAWTYGGKLTQQTHDGLMDTLANILRFNYLMDTSKDSVRFEAIKRQGLKICAQNITSGLKGPYYYSHAHYNIWEAEGNQEYTEGLNLQHPDGIGEIIVDGETISYKVSAGVDPEALIQFGPFGYAQDLGFSGVPKSNSFPHFPWIDYNASYKVKAGFDQNPDSNEAVALLYVARVVRDEIRDVLDTDTLWDSDFPDSVNYFERILSWNTRYFYDQSGIYATGSLGSWSKVWGMELRVFWFGKRDFYIDKVTVYDEPGLGLIEGKVDDDLAKHLQTYHQRNPSLDAWFMREEMHSLGDEVDCVKPWSYVSSYLAEQGDKWGVGSMHIPKHVRDFVNLVNPEELWVHLYLFEGARWHKGEWRYPYAYTTDYQGSDSLSLQVHWDTLIAELKQYNEICLKKNINYTATLQGHSMRTRVAVDTIKNPDDTLTWYWTLREPSGYELECMTNLAIAHGSKGVLYWKYWNGYYRKDTVWVRNGSSYDAVTDYIYMVITGLTDASGAPTERWYWIKDKIGPYLDKLGSLYYDLTWVGAGSSDNVNSIDSSFIGSIQSAEFPELPYIEVAFFADSLNTDYFMLVNRRCLPDESQNVTSYINQPVKYLIIDLYEDDTTLSSHNESLGAIPFTTQLDPGEGKLFKMIPR